MRLICLVGLICLGAASGAGAATVPRLVQKRSVRIASGSSVTLALRKPSTAGDLIVAFLVWDGGGTASLGDTQGNSYASAAGPLQASGHASSAQTFYAANVAGGGDTVTASLTGPVATRAALYLYEYSGLDHATPFDAAVTASGNSPTIDTGPLASASPNELLFFAAESNGRSIARLTRGYRTRTSKYGNRTAERVASSPSTYEVTATQRGTAWTAQLVAFRSLRLVPPPQTAYPRAVSPNGRYLVDQNGAPVLLTGDSPQALMVNLSEADADAFFADRQASGFNVVWINLLCATYTGGRPDGSTYDGIVPFAVANDLSTPNEAYFTRVDHMLQLAAQHGLTVLLDPAETGSFLSVLSANGVTKARKYGRYLGSRYASFDNIVWMSGNDFQTWPNPADDAVVQAVAAGIHDTDGRHIHTVELDYPVSGSLDDPTWAPLIQLNASYTYYPTYAQVLTDYDRANALPTFLVEANYEFEHNAADLGTPLILRRQAYWALLSGACGQLYGNHYTWPFIDGWQSNLDTPGSAQMGLVRFLFASRPWFELVPDETHVVVTSGYGTFADSGALGDNDYLTAARTPDGALVMAYMPTRRTIAVDMSKLGGPAYASWYDPTSGAFVPIAGSPLANAGSQDFTPPGDNASGDGDWVLVLEANGVPPDTEPPSVPGRAVVLGADVVRRDDLVVALHRQRRRRRLPGLSRRSAHPDDSVDDVHGQRPQPADDLCLHRRRVRLREQSVRTVRRPAGDHPRPRADLRAGERRDPADGAIERLGPYAAAQTAGNTNIVAVGWNDVTADLTALTDSAGNGYQQALATFRGNGMSQAIFYATGIQASAAGTNQVTATFDQAAVFVDLRVTEYSGLRQVDPFAGGTSATGVSSNASTSTLAVGTNELLFAGGMTGSAFTGAGSGYTTRLITSPDGDIVEDQVTPAAGNVGATAPLGSGTWLLQLARFAPLP